MDKFWHIVGVLLVLAAGGNIAMTIMHKSQLDDIEKKLEHARVNIDSALINVKAAKQSVDSIENNIDKFKIYIKTIQTDVAIMNTEKEIQEASTKQALKGKQKELIDKLDQLNQIKKEIDSLPYID